MSQPLQPDVERQIDEAFAAIFSGPAGKVALSYLRSITVHKALGPDATFGQLMHKEGGAFLVAVIETRTRQGSKPQ